MPSKEEAATTTITEPAPILEQPQARDPSSSPDLPLAVTHHSRTPTLETAPLAPVTPVIDTASVVETQPEESVINDNTAIEEVKPESMAVVQDIVVDAPVELKMDIDEVPAVTQASSAVLPEEHAATDGLAEPMPAKVATEAPVHATFQVPTEVVITTESQSMQETPVQPVDFTKDVEVYFEDGDVDLLGSLEKSLGGEVAVGEENMEHVGAVESALPAVTAADGVENISIAADTSVPEVPVAEQTVVGGGEEVVENGEAAVEDMKDEKVSQEENPVVEPSVKGPDADAQIE